MNLTTTITDDPAAPLEAYLEARDHVRHEDAATLMSLGDIRRAAAAIRELQSELAVERARLDWLQVPRGHVSVVSHPDVDGEPRSGMLWEGAGKYQSSFDSDIRKAIDKAMGASS